MALLAAVVLVRVPSAGQVPKDSPSQTNDALEQTVRQQVFLDRAGFGPGVIDGKGGEFTQKAIREYQKAHGNPGQPPPQPEGGRQGTEATKSDSLPLDQAIPTYAEYTVTADDEQQIGPEARTPQEESRLKSLPYTSVMELLAEKFHTTSKLLETLNPQLAGHSPKAGDQLKVPNVKPFEIAAVEARRTDEEAPEAKEVEGGPYLDIDIAQKELEVRDGDRILAAFPITPGSTTLPAPKGHWHVLTITFMPKFRYDKEMLFHGKRGSGGIVTPPGPNNKVGVVWMQLNKKGVGIHGTDEPDSIGRTTSHGCIRLANWDVVRVADLIQPGAKVIIH